jgi:hypothetical protein
VSSSAQHKSLFESVVSFLGNGLAVTGVCAALAGCSGGPTKIDVPAYDPSGAASRAMELYDKNSDSFIDEKELALAPGLKAALKNFDSNKDGKLSADEIAARVAVWEKMSIGLMRVSCEVTLDGGLLNGATVQFIPEEFMQGELQEASDISHLGSASPTIPVEKRAAPDVPPGVQVGLYKVVISKKEGNKELIPSKFNTETILGQEVSPDDPAIRNNRVRFTLSTK